MEGYPIASHLAWDGKNFRPRLGPNGAIYQPRAPSIPQFWEVGVGEPTVGEKVKLIGSRYRTLRDPVASLNAKWESENIRVSACETALPTQDKLLGGRLTKVFPNIFTTARSTNRDIHIAGVDPIAKHGCLMKNSRCESSSLDQKQIESAEDEKSAFALKHGLEANGQLYSNPQNDTSTLRGHTDAGQEHSRTVAYPPQKPFQPWQTDYMNNFSADFSDNPAAGGTKLRRTSPKHHNRPELLSILPTAGTELATSPRQRDSTEVNQIHPAPDQGNGSGGTGDGGREHNLCDSFCGRGHLPKPTFFSTYYVPSEVYQKLTE